MIESEGQLYDFKGIKMTKKSLNFAAATTLESKERSCDQNSWMPINIARFDLLLAVHVQIFLGLVNLSTN